MYPDIKAFKKISPWARALDMRWYMVGRVNETRNAEFHIQQARMKELFY